MKRLQITFSKSYQNMRLLHYKSKKPVWKSCTNRIIKWGRKSKSNYQFQLKTFLQPYLAAHIVYEEFPVFGTRLTLDIYDATTKTAYEVQGEQHSKMIPYFHKDREAYLSQIIRDDTKRIWCELNQIKLVEVYPYDLKNLSKEFFKEQNIYL